jgi:hypothetical protein
METFICCNPVATINEFMHEIRSDYLFEFGKEMPQYIERVR